MTDIHIPPEAEEAGAKHIYQNWHRDSADLLPPWEFLAAEYRTRWLDQARAAFEAMVANWEGAEHQTPNEWSNKEHLILPLTENPDAEA